MSTTTMLATAFVLACVACTGHGRRVQSYHDGSGLPSDSEIFAGELDTSESHSELLQPTDPSAAWNVAGTGRATAVDASSILRNPVASRSEQIVMGKGDKRTTRGKIFARSYGKFRPKPKKKRKNSGGAVLDTSVFEQDEDELLNELLEKLDSIGEVIDYEGTLHSVTRRPIREGEEEEDLSSLVGSRLEGQVSSWFEESGWIGCPQLKHDIYVSYVDTKGKEYLGAGRIVKFDIARDEWANRWIAKRVHQQWMSEEEREEKRLDISSAEDENEEEEEPVAAEEPELAEAEEEVAAAEEEVAAAPVVAEEPEPAEAEEEVAAVPVETEESP